MRAESVFDCAVNAESIRNVVAGILESEARNMTLVSNPYYVKNTSRSIHEKIKKALLLGISEKYFHDLHHD